MYMWRRLRLIVAQGAFPILEPEALQSIDEPTFRRLFTDDNGECPLDIALSDRVENLRDLGSVLLKRWDGRFSGLVDASDSSLGDFIRLSRECRAFDDEVAKLPLLNALMLQGSGLARFGDPLLPVVDYHVMKQLVRQGVVVVPQEVRQKLTDGSLLTKQEGSGLRATSFTALLELASVSGVSCDLVDNLLWFNRNVCDDAAPRCGDCLFAKGCRQDVQIKRPLEETRFY